MNDPSFTSNRGDNNCDTDERGNPQHTCNDAGATMHGRLPRGTRKRATELAVSGLWEEEAQHSSLPRARAVPHWFRSAYTV